MPPKLSPPFAEGEEGLLLTSEAFRGILLEILGRGESIRFRARGFSMHPFISDGDLVTVGPPPARIATGDVVAVRRASDDKLLVHRVVVNLPGCLVTKGDAATRPDEMAGEGRVIGQVRRVERDGRAVRVGLGPERLLIALLSRHGLLSPLVFHGRRVRAGLGRLA